MSAFNYYKERGYSPIAPKFRTISNAAVATTITLWTPVSGRRIAATDLTIAKAGALSGTIKFYFGGLNEEQNLGEFSVASSVTIYPTINNWESTALNAPLLVRVSTGESNGWAVTLGGFELD